ncbi:MAG: DUF4159 domain-containing protein [Candidatus Latescibacteria bacterium]|nr:DUF4159 domain-containing protein [Candidatus Latescibacterota bacterium]
MKLERDIPRFSGISNFIDLSKLERETHILLILGFIVAVTLHGVIGIYAVFTETKPKVVKPVSVEFVIRRPRMTKPLEIKKSKVQKKEIYRDKLASNVIIDDNSYIVPPPGEPFDSKISIKNELNNPEAIDQDFPVSQDPYLRTESLRHPQKYISLQEELVSLKDFDNGKYNAMVLQNVRNKQSVKGFVHIAAVWGSQLKIPDALKRSVINLAEAVCRYTDVDAYVDTHLRLDSGKLNSMPFIYITTDKAFELTKTEAENLGAYLRNGGFAVIDNGTPQYEYSQAEASLRQMLRDALGKDARFEPIPNNHPLFHCFFDFDDGPPQGNEVERAIISSQAMGTMFDRMSKIVIFLEGIWIDNRLVAVYSDKGYALKWKEFSNNTPQLRMGVNMVVYALTQDNGMTQKNMAMIVK